MEKPITLGQFSKLQKLIETSGISGPMPISFEFKDINQWWKWALIYNKRQNSFLKAVYKDEVVYTANLLNEETNSLHYYVIRADENWSRNKWFLFFALNSSFASYQQMKQQMEKI